MLNIFEIISCLDLAKLSCLAFLEEDIAIK